MKKPLHFNWDPAKHEWESAIQLLSDANFLQSYTWGSFHERMGNRVVRLLVQSDDEIVALVSAVIEEAKRGTYMAIAGGPLLDWKNSSLVESVFAEVVSKATALNCVNIRFRPQATAEVVSSQILRSLHARPAPMHVTADLTLQLDLHKSDEELLAEMRKNTRAAIKKADRIGITTRTSTDPQEIHAFYEEERKVAERQGFIPFSEEFLETQFLAFLEDDAVALVHAYDEQSQLLASAFIIFYNGEAVYHYGVSTEQNAKLPGSYACQWRAIHEAKSRGCTRYNFWGIAPKEEAEHRFAGVSLFKRGFGGFEVAYLPAQDIPLTARYWITYVFETIRKRYRRL